MSVTASYIPAPSQTDAQAIARAQALGIGLAPRDIPPVYQPFATQLPGVIAEYGTVVFVHDDGTLTGAQVATAIAPLVAQQTADQALAANVAAIQAKADAALTANATYLALATPTQAQAIAQVAVLTREMNALIRLVRGAFDSTTGT